MKPGLEVGLTAEVSTATTPEMAITFDGPPRVSVFSTPALLWELERAARAVLEPFLETGEASVGTSATISHLAATPIGTRVTAKATITAIDRRRVSFAVEAFDEKEKIGEGIHDRFVIDVGRFAARLTEKGG